jgi:hypothetical protein
MCTTLSSIQWCMNLCYIVGRLHRRPRNADQLQVSNMAQNPNFGGQQQPHLNAQYTRTPNQQPTGASQHDYQQAPQQTYYSGQLQQSAYQNLSRSSVSSPTPQLAPDTQPQQQDVYQSSNQTPIYASTQQLAQNTQLQHQPSYQQSQHVSNQGYNSGSMSQPWTQPSSNTEWQNATQSVTTTTTTTTTTKSSKQRQASQLQQSASYASSDFSSPMQQAPQPPPVQHQQTIDYTQLMQSGSQQHQPPQQQHLMNYSQFTQNVTPQQPLLPQPLQQQQTVNYNQFTQNVAPQQQQQTVNYSHFMKNTSQQQRQPQPQPQQTSNYSQLMQPIPQTQTSPVDFSRLIQTGPPPPLLPQPEVSRAPPVLQAPKPTSKSQAPSSTTKKTMMTAKKTSVVGGSSRQEAAEQGDYELCRFDRDVSRRLQRIEGGICPVGYDYYATRQGYLCGGGSHFYSHEDVEAMLKYGRHPECENVNVPIQGSGHRLVTPPPGNGNGSGDEPAFWTAKEQLAELILPLAHLRDPKKRRAFIAAHRHGFHNRFGFGYKDLPEDVLGGGSGGGPPGGFGGGLGGGPRSGFGSSRHGGGRGLFGDGQRR